jgi:hypothetical protein
VGQSGPPHRAMVPETMPPGLTRSAGTARPSPRHRRRGGGSLNRTEGPLPCRGLTDLDHTFDAPGQSGPTARARRLVLRRSCFSYRTELRKLRQHEPPAAPQKGRSLGPSQLHAACNRFRRCPATQRVNTDAHVGAVAEGRRDRCFLRRPSQNHHSLLMCHSQSGRALLGRGVQVMFLRVPVAGHTNTRGRASVTSGR